MGFWRRKPVGFKWQKHVRTTILVRRKARAEQAHAAKAAVASHARRFATDAQSQLARMGRVIRHRAGALPGQVRAHVLPEAERQARRLGGHVASGARAGVRAGARHVADAAEALKAHPRPRLTSASAQPARLPRVREMAVRAYQSAGEALAAASRVVGPSARAAWRWCVGRAASLAVSLATSVRQAGAKLPASRLKHAAPLVAAFVIGCGTALAISGGFNWSGTTGITNSLPSLSFGFSPRVVETVSGRARAETGDTLRLNGRRLRLAGVAAPLMDQRCRNSRGIRWRCGRHARRILSRLIARRTVTCDVLDRSADDVTLARCRAGSRDIAAEIIAKGWAFTTDEAVAALRDEEDAARGAKRGLWAGAAEHPDTLRRAL